MSVEEEEKEEEEGKKIFERISHPPNDGFETKKFVVEQHAFDSAPEKEHKKKKQKRNNTTYTSVNFRIPWLYIIVLLYSSNKSPSIRSRTSGAERNDDPNPGLVVVSYYFIIF